MAMPPDDGVSRHYWDSETGFLMDREVNDPVLNPDGEPIAWVEPEQAIDPNESLPYDGPTLWAVTAHRYDLPPSITRTFWVEKPTLEEALELWNDTAAKAGMVRLSIVRWEPENLAQHIRWSDCREGDLAAIISREAD